MTHINVTQILIIAECLNDTDLALAVKLALICEGMADSARDEEQQAYRDNDSSYWDKRNKRKQYQDEASDAWIDVYNKYLALKGGNDNQHSNTNG